MTSSSNKVGAKNKWAGFSSAIKLKLLCHCDVTCDLICSGFYAGKSFSFQLCRVPGKLYKEYKTDTTET